MGPLIKCLIIATLGMAAAACINHGGVHSHCPGQSAMETTLYFGASRPDGGIVEESQWEQFVADTIAPRFNTGFTELAARGAWLNDTPRELEHEASRMIIRIHYGGDEAEQHMQEIVGEYKRRFNQQSVLRVDQVVCATF